LNVMNKIQKFKLDIKGLRELMKSDEMQSILGDSVQSVQKTAEGMAPNGSQFGTAVRTVKYVAIGTVYPEGEKAVKATYEENLLEKALGSSGLPREKG